MTSEGTGGDPLTDAALQSEIELVGDLVAAASESEGPLGEHELDRLLGVSEDGATDEDTGAEDTAAGAAADAGADADTDTDTEGEPGRGHRTEGVT